VRRVNSLSRCVVAFALAWISGAAGAADYPLIASPAPDFALRGFAGDNIRLSEHRGEVIVLSFWSASCVVCKAQLAALNRSYGTYHSAGLQVYGISIDDDQSRARDYAGAHALAFEMLADPGKSVGRLYQVDSLPMVVLIDRSGMIRNVYHDFGSRNEALYLQQLRALLNE